MKRFLVGFLVGAAVGAAVVVLVTPKSGIELVEIVKTKVNTAIKVGQEAAELHEKKLWDEFHKRLDDHLKDEKPKDKPGNRLPSS